MTLSPTFRLPLLAAGAALLAALVLLLARGGGAPLPSGAPAGDGPAHGASTAQRVAALQRAVRSRPGDPQLRAGLAAAELQSVRETGDASAYARADGVLAEGLRAHPDDPGLLTERGVLRLARHDFRGALADGERAHALAPAVVKTRGVLVDALVELGRYDRAETELQAMVDQKPSLDSYARIAYFRELHGDLPGAATALGQAISAGGGAAENAAYVRTLLGDLELQRGRPAAARRVYSEALARFPRFAAAESGLARADAADGRLGPAIARLRGVVARLPLPQHVVALGEAQLAAGRAAAGRRDLALVRAQERILAAAGVDTDVDHALFEADHGDPRAAVRRARAAWSAAPSVRSADALAWALTRAGRAREALPWTRRALRLGTRDATVLFHAGATAAAAGDRATARQRLRAALRPRGALSPLAARRARALLAGAAR